VIESAFLFCHRRRTVESSQQTVPVGTGRHRKEITMRTTSLATLAAALMLAGSGVYAQPAPQGNEGPFSPFSPFTYERLGATPSIRLHRAARPADATEAQAKAQAALKSPATVSAPEAARAAAARAEAAPAPLATPASAQSQ
jgi:hypothetical protein